MTVMESKVSQAAITHHIPQSATAASSENVASVSAWRLCRKKRRRSAAARWGMAGGSLTYNLPLALALNLPQSVAPLILSRVARRAEMVERVDRGRLRGRGRGDPE